MTDRPIIFSAPMVRALLDGRKTQTRRVLNPQPDTTSDPSGLGAWGAENRYGYWRPTAEMRPYQIGDRLYVREAHRPQMDAELWACVEYKADGARIKPKIDDDRAGGVFWEQCNAVDPDWRQWGIDPAEARWRPSIHMPRWASRITLTVTEVRVQRLHEITFKDTLDEGIEATDIHARRHRACLDGTGKCGSVCRDSFVELWNSLHGSDAWKANPWVVAVTFTVQKVNIDHIG